MARKKLAAVPYHLNAEVQTAPIELVDRQRGSDRAAQENRIESLVIQRH
jgi:hypothetical protein